MPPLGLIGTAMAGGLRGFGETGAAVAATYAKQYEEGELEKQKQEAIAQREMNLAALNNAAAQGRLEYSEGKAGERQQAGFRHAERLERDIRQPFQAEQQSKLFEHQEAMQEAQQAWHAEQNEMQRNLTQEQIASHEKIAQANNANALKIAQIGGTIQQDKDGNVLWFDKSGNAKQIMDPNNPDQPMKGLKDLTPAAKAYSDTIKAQLVDLDRAEVAAYGDATQISAIGQRRAALMKEQLNVLTGGISEAGKASPATVNAPAAAITALKADQKLADQFDQKYGAGAAAKVLSGAGEMDPSRFTTKALERTKQDPVSGERLTKTQFERKFGKGSFDKAD